MGQVTWVSHFEAFMGLKMGFTSTPICLIKTHEWV